MKETTLLLTNKYANFLPSSYQDIPSNLKLHKCFPYLINSNRLIRFEIPKSKSLINHKVRTTLTIFDVFRNIVTTLVNDKLKPGTYEILWNVGNLTSGTYFYELTTDNERITHRLELLNNN